MSKKYIFSVVTIALFMLLCVPDGLADDSPYPARFIKPSPITMAKLAKRSSEGVLVVEVSDYVYGNYQGKFESPPHADFNPQKALIITWKDFPFRFVFSHEASYCPWFELPSGAGTSMGFLKGKEGHGLMNQWGRKERNSFVDIIESGPERVWVRWTYFGVDPTAGYPSFRATEDFWAYPNGLILRRQTYRTLSNYAMEPIEMIGICPAGKLWPDVLQKGNKLGMRHALTVLDAFSPKRPFRPNDMMPIGMPLPGCAGSKVIRLVTGLSGGWCLMLQKVVNDEREVSGRI